MNEYRFEAEIALDEGLQGAGVRERVYGAVTVSARWPVVPWTEILRVPMTVRGELEARDAPAYVELFFHDVFLLLNLASPGTFGGSIAVTGGALRIRKLAFDARLFAIGSPRATLPLDEVTRWYDGLNVGTQQLATSGDAIALLQLLHLARAAECEEAAILRLAIAAEAVVESGKVPPRLLELREEVAYGRAPIVHPMHDDALDPRVEDITREWIEVADTAAGLVISELQERVRRAARDLHSPHS